MPQDFYADAHELATELRARGHDEWADRIGEDIRSGSTGTEILMRLRSTLAELAEARPALPGTMRREVARQIAALAAAVR